MISHMNTTPPELLYMMANVSYADPIVFACNSYGGYKIKIPHILPDNITGYLHITVLKYVQALSVAFQYVNMYRYKMGM